MISVRIPVVIASERKMSAVNRLRGFSLIELVITLAILAITVLAAIPAFTESRARSELRAATNELASGLRWARSESLRTNLRSTFIAGTGAVCANGDRAAWSITNGGSVVRCASVADFQSRFPNISSLSPMSVEFSGRGAVAAPVSAYAVSGRDTSLSRAITIEASGRVFEVST